jgi:broad specificity phosphatase PhoE
MTGRTLLEPDTSGAPEQHESGPSSPPATGTLWLVRHGQSGWNVAGRIQGQSPAAPGLTATGRNQAALAARELARRVPHATCATFIVASDLARAAETAEIIAGQLGLPIEFDPALREQSLGDLEGHSAFAAPEAGGIPGPSGAAEKKTAQRTAGTDAARERAEPGGAEEGAGTDAARGRAEPDGAEEGAGTDAARGRAEPGGAEEGAQDRRGKGAAERDAAEWAAAEWAAADEAMGDVLDAFWEDPFRKPLSGESVAEMYDRVHRALDRMTAAHPGADLIIVTHGGPVRVAGAEHPPKPGQAFPRTAIANASITPTTRCPA